MTALWAVFTFWGSGQALTAHGSLGLKQEIQIQIQIRLQSTQKCQLTNNIKAQLPTFTTERLTVNATDTY
jgi:hypothetical protein